MKEFFNTLTKLIGKTHTMMQELNSICSDEQIMDINPRQVYLICNMTPNKEYRVKDLTNYFFYSNVTYNILDLVKSGYLNRENSTTDLRSVNIKLTEKGEKLYKLVYEKLSEKYSVEEFTHDIEC